MPDWHSKWEILTVGGGHRAYTSRLPLDMGPYLGAEMAELPDWDRLSNPFEAKWLQRNKFPKGGRGALNELLADLESHEFIGDLSKLFGLDLVIDTGRHYTGLFRYEKHDHLSVHVDAGVHPATGFRKAVTVVIYVGSTAGSPLEFWSGTACTAPEPSISHLAGYVPATPGKMVAFLNNDHAWHGVTEQLSNEPRYVVTVSYLANRSPGLPGMRNPRQRAYFVPRPDEHWTEETEKLRDLRADPERFAEAYRV